MDNVDAIPVKERGFCAPRLDSRSFCDFLNKWSIICKMLNAVEEEFFIHLLVVLNFLKFSFFHAQIRVFWRGRCCFHSEEVHTNICQISYLIFGKVSSSFFSEIRKIKSFSDAQKWLNVKIYLLTFEKRTLKVTIILSALPRRVLWRQRAWKNASS